MSNRRVLLAAVSTLAIGMQLVPAAAVGSPTTRHKISETHTVITIGSQGKPGTDSFRLITAGAIDGRIGATRFHGAERALVKLIGSSREIVRGTEFDLGGSRSFVLHIDATTTTNGQVIESGTGTWTGGTGSYKNARGTFRISGGGPLGGVHTVHIKGSIAY